MNELEKVPGGWGAKGSRAKYLKHLFIAYKLQQQDFERLWREQGGKCLGCAMPFAHPWERGAWGARCQVDHRHIAGERCKREDVRSLLCGACNKQLHRYENWGTMSAGETVHMLKMLPAHNHALGAERINEELKKLSDARTDETVELRRQAAV